MQFFECIESPDSRDSAATDVREIRSAGAQCAEAASPQTHQRIDNHQLQEGGAPARSSDELHGIQMSDSAYARRRQLRPVKVLEQVLSTARSPLADPRLYPENFFRGYRLVGCGWDAMTREPGPITAAAALRREVQLAGTVNRVKSTTLSVRCGGVGGDCAGAGFIVPPRALLFFVRGNRGARPERLAPRGVCDRCSLVHEENRCHAT